MDYRDRILQLLKYRPQLPTAIAKALGVNTIIAGAMLSEMVSKRILRVSNLKIGSSPLYFLPQNEALLEEFKDNLDGKSVQAFELLKEHRVLRDADQTPLVRVCLKQIRDFSRPLEVQYDGKSELFYKWFLLSDDQAKDIIRRILNPEERLVVERKETEVDQQLREKVASDVDQSKDVVATDVRGSVRAETKADSRGDSRAQSKSETKAESKDESRADYARGDVVAEKGKVASSESDAGRLGKDVSTKKKVVEEQQPLTASHLANDVLVKDVAMYCKENKIGILWHEVKRKGAEAHFELSIPSPVGRMTFFAVAKSKKTVNEADLSQAYVGGQLRKLPVVFLSKGSASKKAVELLKDLKGLTFTSM